MKSRLIINPEFQRAYQVYKNAKCKRCNRRRDCIIIAIEAEDTEVDGTLKKCSECGGDRFTGETYPLLGCLECLREMKVVYPGKKLKNFIIEEEV